MDINNADTVDESTRYERLIHKSTSQCLFLQEATVSKQKTEIQEQGVASGHWLAKVTIDKDIHTKVTLKERRGYQSKYNRKIPLRGWNGGNFIAASGILKIYRTTKPENHWQQNLCSHLFARSPIDAGRRPNLETWHWSPNQRVQVK
jgi:hypothetical protein